MNCLFTSFFLLSLLTGHAMYADTSKMDYWQVQRKGANFFNKTPTQEWFIAAKETGIQFARLSPDKWKSDNRDFLLGDADAFKEISAVDFQTLKNTLDQAHQHNIKVVLTLLSLPGSRWKQNNHDQDDLRIWHHEEYQVQAALFWKELANLLKDHPAVVGYNILNEPHPERLFGIGDFREIDFQQWYASVQGSLADLNLFHQKVVAAIREVDANTPIILDTGLYATAWAISYLNPMNDPGVLYSFHMYEPYAYTTRKINNGSYEYPGSVPDANSPTTHWNEEALQKFLEPIASWQRKFQIPSSQILVGEFGCDRTSKGAEHYLDHLVHIFDSHRWHWAFYSFREDCWDSMDYELGAGKLTWKYWDAVEEGVSLDPFRHDNPLFDIIKNRLAIEQPVIKGGHSIVKQKCNLHIVVTSTIE